MKRIFSGATLTSDIENVEIFRVGIPNNKTWIIKEIRTACGRNGDMELSIYVNGQILWQMALETITGSIHINEQYTSGTEMIFVIRSLTVDNVISSASMIIDES